MINCEIVDVPAESQEPTEAAQEGAEFAAAEEDEEQEEFECPECGARVTEDMNTCLNCGVGLSFEYEEE
jgi:N utilization substance protein A